MELAFAHNDGPTSAASPTAGDRRPTLRIVPDPTSTARPPLPRRPSRRAVVRAQVWGVPISRRGGTTERVDENEADTRIAEAVRLLAGL